MFTIIHQNKHNKQFYSDFYFNTIAKAKGYLLSEGYLDNNRICTRGDMKAYIQPLKEK